MCNGKPHIYYFVDNVGENKLRGKFEANRFSDISKYLLVVEWRNIGNFGVAMGYVRSLMDAYLRLNKGTIEGKPFIPIIGQTGTPKDLKTVSN